MRVSFKGRTALAAMLDIAANQHVGRVSLTQIAASQGVSKSYLEQIFAALRRQGLVQGVRGTGGGYRLTRPATKITMAEIISAVDGSVPPESTATAGQSNLSGRNRFAQNAWQQLTRQTYEFLDGISLAEFVHSHESEESAFPTASDKGVRSVTHLGETAALKKNVSC